jgi:hypothetical protein|tara:strand:- start:5880 stop:6725 length:846 start_codon:yes stop_codon:yes gene_type:complete
MINKILLIKTIVVSLLIITSCKKDDNIPINAGNDPNFTIVTHSDNGFSSFNRKVVVFGIDIYAVVAVEDAKLLHTANVMAQYLDNDEDGIVDDQLVLNKMIENKAFMVMWKNENDLNIDPPNGREGQDLGNDETHPNFVSNGKTGEFDASLEEVLHIINNAGHSYAYPEAFGQNVGSDLANAMDIARGGQFMTIPNEYPINAWYTYDDQTCDYSNCQTVEYLYWALTSMLGAQENRLDDIDNEWKLNTNQKVEDTDSAIFSLLTNPTYKMPTVLPDGSYKH